MKKGTTEDEMVGWNHGLHGHEFEQALGDSEGQGSLACCRSWDHKRPTENTYLSFLKVFSTLRYILADKSLTDIFYLC